MVQSIEKLSTNSSSTRFPMSRYYILFTVKHCPLIFYKAWHYWETSDHLSRQLLSNCNVHRHHNLDLDNLAILCFAICHLLWSFRHILLLQVIALESLIFFLIVLVTKPVLVPGLQNLLLKFQLLFRISYRIYFNCTSRVEKAGITIKSMVDRNLGTHRAVSFYDRAESWSCYYKLTIPSGVSFFSHSGPPKPLGHKHRLQLDGFRYPPFLHSLFFSHVSKSVQFSQEHRKVHYIVHMYIWYHIIPLQ